MKGIRRAFKRIAKGSAVAGLVLCSFFSSCTPRTDRLKTEQPKLRCYGYSEKKLRVYAEHPDSGGKSRKLGTEHVLEFSQLGIPDNNMPLAYFCNYSGDLVWIGKEKAFIRKIRIADNRLSIRKDDKDSKSEIWHTLPTEYKWAGEVVSADIWRAPGRRWEDLTIATLTINGVLQLLRLDQDAFAENRPDRGIYDFANYNKLDPGYRWPKKGIRTGLVHLIDSEEIVILPIGKKGKGTARYYYHVTVKGKKGTSLQNKERKFLTDVMEHTDKESYTNVYEVVKPLRLDRAEGGIVIDVTAEDKDGKKLNLLTIIKEL